MEKGLKTGLSLLVTTLMLTSIVPAGVMAEQTEIPAAAVVQTNNNKGNSQEEVFVFENGQVIRLSNTKDEASMKMATSQNSVQLKEESPQVAILNPEIQTDALENAYEVTDVDGGVRITKYSGIGGDVVVPATLNDKTVLEIGMAAFENNNSLTSVFLPEGLKRIGREAFQGCHNLTKVTFPESLEAIEGWAFASCILTSISLPKNVSIIGGNPFNQCPRLTSISLSPLNPNYQLIGGLLVDKTGKTLIACPGGALNPVIPEGITAIGDQAFAGCYGLTNVSLPESLVSIGSMAFIHTGLTTINLPKGVSSIERWSLGHCEDLSSITVAHDNSYYTSITGCFSIRMRQL